MDDLTRRIKQTLTECFNQASEYRVRNGQKIAIFDPGPDPIELPNLKFKQPAADFEKRNGLHDIAHHYVLPEGLKPAEMQDYLIMLGEFHDRLHRIADAEFYAGLEALWQELNKLNPGLFDKSLSAEKDRRKIWWGIMGMASGYAPVDIQFFMDGNTYGNMRANEEWNSRVNRITELMGPIRGWVPSFETLDKIESQVPKAKKKKPTSSPRH